METKPNKKDSVNNETNEKSNIQETNVETKNEHKPKKTAQEKLNDAAKELAEKIKNSGLNSTVRASAFNAEATGLLQAQILITLADGNNPSAKYLKQKIIAKGVPKAYINIMNKLLVNWQFVEAGKGIEFILTKIGTVCKMDNTKFIPQEVYKQSKDTYIDTIDLPDMDSNLVVKKCERSIQLYPYIQYFINGELQKLVQIIIDGMENSIWLSIFEDLIDLLQEIKNNITAKAASTENTPTNHIVGSATSPIEAIKELNDYLWNIYTYNVKFNYGYDKDGKHVDFTDAPNYAKDMYFIVDVEVYNNLKKMLPFIYHQESFISALLKDESRWIVLPKSILRVNKNDTAEIDSIPSIEDNFSLFKDTNGNRIKGGILVVDTDGLQVVENLHNIESQYYPANMTTQYWNRRNIKMKMLKWGQVALYQNEHLEDALVIPTKEQTTKEQTTKEN